MNKSRRKFLGKAPAVVIGAGVGVASGKIAMASQSDWPQGTKPLLDFMIAGQRKINGKLYVSDYLILQVLRMVIPHLPIDQSAANAKLTQAEGYIDEVPGPGYPGCELPPGYGDGYGGG